MQPQISENTTKTLLILEELTGLSQTELIERSVRLFSRPYRNEKGLMALQKGWYLKEVSNPQIKAMCHIIKTRTRQGQVYFDICLQGKIIQDVPHTQVIPDAGYKKKKHSRKRKKKKPDSMKITT